MKLKNFVNLTLKIEVIMKKLKLLVITLMMSLMSLSGYSYSNYGVWSSPNFLGILTITIVLD